MSAALKAIAWKRAIVLFPIFLTVALFLINARLDLRYAPFGLALQVAAGVLLLSGVGAVAVSALITAVVRVSRKLWRKSLSGVTLFTLRQAVKGYCKPVQAHSIGEQEGNVVIKLPLGEDSGTLVGQRILAANTATGDIIGVVEPVEVREASCLCLVADRMDQTEFWEDLESRKRRDFSPPQGVVFSREIPDGFWDFTEKVTLHWRG